LPAGCQSRPLPLADAGLAHSTHTHTHTHTLVSLCPAARTAAVLAAWHAITQRRVLLLRRALCVRARSARTRTTAAFADWRGLVGDVRVARARVANLLARRCVGAGVGAGVLNACTGIVDVGAGALSACGGIRVLVHACLPGCAMALGAQVPAARGLHFFLKMEVGSWPSGDVLWAASFGTRPRTPWGSSPPQTPSPHKPPPQEHRRAARCALRLGARGALPSRRSADAVPPGMRAGARTAGEL